LSSFPNIISECDKYSKQSLIRVHWKERPSGLMKQKVALKGKKLRTQINGKFHDISSTDENK
jgi:hypothetical protein